MNRSAIRFAACAIAFVLLPAAITLVLASRAMTGSDSLAGAAPDTGLLPPAMVEHVAGRPVAVVLVSNEMTEVTDLLAPYAILAASEAFNVYTVAPKRQVSNLWPGAAVAPDFAFDDFDARHPAGPDLIVVPYFGDHGNPELVEWLRARAKSGVGLVSICEGARTVAAAGLLRGRKATSHFYALPELRAAYPETTWIGDVRAVTDGNVISSGGVTAAVDATLLAIRITAGAAAAERATRAIGFDEGVHSERVDGLSRADLVLLTLQAAYDWQTTDIGVVLTPGVDELRLAAYLDTHPRTFAARAITLASTGEPIRSRHGLRLVPRATLATAPRLDRLVVTASGGDDVSLDHWAAGRGLRIELPAETSSIDAYAQQLRDVAMERGAGSARLVAKLIEFPSTRIDLSATPSGSDRIVAMALQPLLLGVVGVCMTRWGFNRCRKREP